MGLFLSKLTTLFASFGAAEPARILMLGLDAAGMWAKRSWFYHNKHEVPETYLSEHYGNFKMCMQHYILGPRHTAYI